MAGLMGRSRRDEAIDRALTGLRETFERALAEQRDAAAASEARLTREIERLKGLCGGLEERLRETSRRADEANERARHADQDGARVGRAEENAAALSARLEHVERQYDGALPTITRALVERLEHEQRAAGADSLPTTVTRLDRELKAQAAELEKVTRALFERMELLRPR